MPQASGPVVTRGASSIRTGKVKDPTESHHLQSHGDKSMGRTEGVQIHQIEALATKHTISKKKTSFLSCLAQKAGSLKDGEIGPREWKASGISVIHKKRSCLGLQSVTQRTQATPRHQIQHSQRPTFGLDASEEHAQIPRRTGAWVEKTCAEVKAGGPFPQGQPIVRSNHLGAQPHVPP
jgi:hypothetical protein